MEKTILYIERWISTMTLYLVKNIVAAAFVYIITSYAVKSDVFETFGATKSCLFAILMCNVWQGTFNSITNFFSESSYITDDINKFLPVRTYILSNFLIQLFLCLAEAVECTIIFGIFFDYSNKGIVSFLPNRSAEYFITFFLILLSCDMLGFAVGVAIKRINSVMTAIPIILISQFLFSGCLFELSENLEAFSKITTAKWGFKALGIISDLNSFLPEEAAVADFKYSASGILGCWFELIVITFVCTVLAGTLLYIRMNREDH